jgi:ribosomal protein L11 methylase PrmA
VTALLAALDADLGDRLAPGATDLAGFEQAFIEQVESSEPDPEIAWDHFYDATLARVSSAWGSAAPGVGTVATFTRIWARAAELSRGESALDVGTCFGFLPLAWAARPAAPRLLAVDLSSQSVALAARQARRLDLPVTLLCADGGQLPLDEAVVGTVMLLHVLEHLTPCATRMVVGEAQRVARDRVVIAVPVEAEPDPVFGHLQVFDVRRLAKIGHLSGWHASALADDDGAWLVLDRP